MPYVMSFKDMMILHFLVGVTIATLIGMWYANKSKPRHIFHYSDELFGLGTIKVWKKWAFIGLLIEVATSFFYIHTGMFYLEVGYSIFEVIPFLLGTFIVDRVFMIFYEHDPSDYVHKPVVSQEDVDKVKEHVTGAAKHASNIVKDFLKPEAKETKEDPTINENKKFDDQTRGH